MEIAGISDFESLAAATNAPVFTPQTDDFGLAVHIFKMLNRGIHPYSSGELDLEFLTWTTIFRLFRSIAACAMGAAPLWGR